MDHYCGGPYLRNNSIWMKTWSTSSFHPHTPHSTVQRPMKGHTWLVQNVYLQLKESLFWRKLLPLEEENLWTQPFFWITTLMNSRLSFPLLLDLGLPGQRVDTTKWKLYIVKSGRTNPCIYLFSNQPHIILFSVVKQDVSLNNFVFQENCSYANE